MRMNLLFTHYLLAHSMHMHESCTHVHPTSPPDTDLDAREQSPDAPDQLVVDERTIRTPKVWLLVFVLGAVLFLDGLDLSMIGVALPEIRQALTLEASSAQWLISGYILGYGGFLLLGGRASDLLGRRQVFLAAALVFGVASVVSALVDSATLIVALRFIKGVSAAFTVPAGLSIITTTFAEGAARNRAFSIYTVCGASGFLTRTRRRWPAHRDLVACGAVLPRTGRPRTVLPRMEGHPALHLGSVLVQAL